MKVIARRAAASLLETLNFTGLSGEQALLASIVSTNPYIDPHVCQRARSLLLLDEGATATEVSHSISISRRSLAELIQRFRAGGLCAALLGLHASKARRAWLTLSPASPPRVQFQRAARTKKRLVDNAAPAATSTAEVVAATLSPTRQVCGCSQTDAHKADLQHSGGQEPAVSRA